MGRNGSSKVFTTDNKRVSDTLSQKTSLSLPQHHKRSLLHSRIRCNDGDNRKDEISENFRKSSALPKFLVHDVSDSKERWLEPAYIQFKSPEPICYNRTIQIDKCISNTRVPATERLAVQSGSFTCLLSPTYKRKSQAISSADLQGRTATNDLPSLRPKYGSESICFIDQLDCSNSEAEGSTNNCVPGRLFNSPSGSIHVTNSRTNAPRPPALPRLADKSRKMLSCSRKESSLFRYPLGSLEEQKIPSRRKNEEYNQQDTSFAEKQTSKTSRITECCGALKLCKFCCAQRQVAFSRTPNIPQLFTEQACSSSTVTRKSYNRPKMVAPKLSSVFSNSPTTADPFHNDRCFRSSLGSTNRRTFNIRDMDRRRKSLTLQYQGDACGPESSREPRLPTASVDDVTPMRQSHSCDLLAERRRNKICSSVGADGQGFSPNQSQSDSTVGLSHSRSLQQPCRSFIEAPATAGVASPRTLRRKDIPQVRDTSSGSLRISSGACSSQLCVTGDKRYNSPISRCFFSSMELQPSLDISTTIHNSESPVSFELGDRSVPDSGPTLGTSFLASRSKVTSAGSSVHDIQTGTEPHRYNDQPSTSQSPGDDLGGLEVWGWSRNLIEWSKNQRQLLLSSWRPSTRRTYRAAWNRWLSWSKKHKLDPFQPDGSILARFLADLHIIEKLSYNTILLHKSVVATLCNANQPTDLSSHTLVKHIIKSIALKKPANRKPPIWDINVLVDYMQSMPIDENNTFDTSRHTAALLLLCSGRRIHDLTLLSIDSQHLVENNNSLVMWPIFGSKTDSSEHRQSGWRLISNSENKKLDPVFWVKQTMKLLEPKRQACNCTNLFINIRGKPKAASRTVIAGWFKSLLKEAGISASAGSVRSAVASRNWADNLPLDEILSRGNWKTCNTFARFYKREIQPQPANSSVTSLFNPID